MEGLDYAAARFEGAVLILPGQLREPARRLDRRERAACEELRVRVGFPMTALIDGVERELGTAPVTRRDISELLEIATGASVHAVRDQLRSGYITVRGGYRVGLAGNVVTVDGHTAGFSAYSSANVRIAREIRGAADGIMAELTRGGVFRSTLIIAPPGAGKTTLLRDITAKLSDGFPGLRGMRVSLADERGEVAAIHNGVPQLYVGRRTDVLDGCPKAEAAMMLLRSMSPEALALDEITAPADVEAIRSARNCGVALLATAHGEGLSDLMERPVYRPLFEDKVFRRVVTISRDGGARRYEVTEW